MESSWQSITDFKVSINSNTSLPSLFNTLVTERAFWWNSFSSLVPRCYRDPNKIRNSKDECPEVTRKCLDLRVFAPILNVHLKCKDKIVPSLIIVVVKRLKRLRTHPDPRKIPLLYLHQFELQFQKFATKMFSWKDWLELKRTGVRVEWTFDYLILKNGIVVQRLLPRSRNLCFLLSNLPSFLIIRVS